MGWWWWCREEGQGAGTPGMWIAGGVEVRYWYGTAQGLRLQCVFTAWTVKGCREFSVLGVCALLLGGGVNVGAAQADGVGPRWWDVALSG